MSLYKKEVFSLRLARFGIFALGAPRFSHFQQSALACTKQKLSSQGQHVSSFSHWVHQFLAIFSKVHEFVENSVFSPRSPRFVIFALGALLVSVFGKVHEFVQNSVFSRRSARLSFSHCVQRLVANFRKIDLFLQNSVLRPRSARFVNSALGAPLLSHFLQIARVCPKTTFSVP